MTKLIVVLQIS